MAGIGLEGGEDGAAGRQAVSKWGLLVGSGVTCDRRDILRAGLAQEHAVPIEAVPDDDLAARLDDPAFDEVALFTAACGCVHGGC